MTEEFWRGWGGRTSVEVESVSRKIVELLSEEKRPLTTEYICLKLNIAKSLASSALYKLLREGIVERVYTETYDPTQPFDTAMWVLKEGVKQAEGAIKPAEGIESKHTKLVLSMPLSMHSLRADLLNRFEALDLHDAYTHVIEMARQELKIMCPVIDAYALYPLISKILSSKGLKIRVLTEIGKSRDVMHLLESLGSKSIEVKNAEKTVRYEGYERKAFGIHAKLVIADNEVALIGSFNLSRHHYLVNFDIGFLIYDQAVVNKLSLIFEEMWNYVSATD